MTQEQLEISILLAVVIFLIAVAVIIKIVEKKNLLNNDETDFISNAIEKKKKNLLKTGGISFNAYVAMMIGFPIVVGGAGWFLMDNKVIVIALAIATVFIPDIISKAMRSKRDVEFEIRYVKALNAFASCLKSQMTVQQAVEDVGDNKFVHPEMQQDFKNMSSNLKLGIGVEETFRKYAAEKGSEDAEDVASAMAMQSVVGGGEAELIESLANNISKRIMIRREIKSLFAQTEVLATFMDFAPFAVLLIMYFGAPMFVQPYFESTAMTLVLIAVLAFTIIGSFVIKVMMRNAKKGSL